MIGRRFVDGQPLRDGDESLIVELRVEIASTAGPSQRLNRAGRRVGQRAAGDVQRGGVASAVDRGQLDRAVVGEAIGNRQCRGSDATVGSHADCRTPVRGQRLIESARPAVSADQKQSLVAQRRVDRVAQQIDRRRVGQGSGAAERQRVERQYACSTHADGIVDRGVCRYRERPTGDRQRRFGAQAVDRHIIRRSDRDSGEAGTDHDIVDGGRKLIVVPVKLIIPIVGNAAAVPHAGQQQPRFQKLHRNGAGRSSQVWLSSSGLPHRSDLRANRLEPVEQFHVACPF